MQAQNSIQMGSVAEGAAVTLTGDQALKFTRYRDTEKDFSNNSRMERQKQYLVNFMGQAVKAMKSDMGLPVSLYQSLTDDMVTNLSLDRSVYLATEAMDMHFTADGIVSLKAKSKKESPAQWHPYAACGGKKRTVRHIPRSVLHGISACKESSAAFSVPEKASISSAVCLGAEALWLSQRRSGFRIGKRNR